MPFIHIFYPNTQNEELIAIKKSYKKGELTRSEYIGKKREVTYFGYSSWTNFFYAIGKPITMLYFSILLMYASFYINEKSLASALRKTAILGTGISFYFVVWAFWYMADFPKTLYYISIGIVAILATFCSHEFIRSRNLILLKVQFFKKHVFSEEKKIDKLNKPISSDNEVLNSVRDDLELHAEKQIKKKEKEIAENSRAITKIISNRK